MNQNEHETVKDYICDMLEYYGIPSRTEYELPGGKRVDVVGFLSQEGPEIGIEVENTHGGDIGQDAAKLASFPKFQYRFIIRFEPVHNTTLIKEGKEILYFKRPDQKDRSFEDKIRSIVHEDDKQYFESLRESQRRFTKPDDIAAIDDFMKIVESNGCDVDVITEIVYDASTHIVLYSNPSNQKEFSFLRAFRLLDNSRYGGGYELSGEPRWNYVVQKLVEKFIITKEREIKGILSEYPKPLILILLAGSGGHLIEGSKLFFTGYTTGKDGRTLPTYGSYPTQPGIRDDSLSDPSPDLRRFLDDFAINNTEWKRMNGLTSLKYEKVRDKITELYSKLSRIGVAVIGNVFTSRGAPLNVIRIPLEALMLEAFDLQKEYDSDKLKDFAKWYILSSRRNFRREDILYRAEQMGLSKEDIAGAVSELSKAGITSDFLPEIKGMPSTDAFVVNDFQRFDTYCNDRINELAQQILHI